MGPVKDRAILQELLKLVKLGAARETTKEPYIIPVFGVPKKNGTVRLEQSSPTYLTCVRKNRVDTRGSWERTPNKALLQGSEELSRQRCRRFHPELLQKSQHMMILPQKPQRVVDPARQLFPAVLCCWPSDLLKLSEHRNRMLHPLRSESHPQEIKAFLCKMTLVPVDPPSIPL